MAIITVSTTEPAIVAYANETTTAHNKGDYQFQYCVTGQWDNHINAMITITNTDEEAIDNWAIKYKINGEIEVKDGTVCTEEIIVTNYFEDNMNNLDIDLSDVDGDEDTDNDGVSDYWEAMNGYEPIISDNIFLIEDSCVGNQYSYSKRYNCLIII